MNSPLRRHYEIEEPLDLAASCYLFALGHGDPCLRIEGPDSVRFVVAGPEGPLVVRGCQEETRLQVEVRGNGADWLEPYVPDLFGLNFRPPLFDEPRRLRTLSQRLAGLRVLRLPSLFPRLLQIVLQQLVSFKDASHGWRTLVRRYGVRQDHDLWSPPTPQVLSKLAPFEFVECGILPEQGRRVVHFARLADKIEATWCPEQGANAVDETCCLLEKIRGVGPWTIGYLRGSGLGDSDAVVLGDYGFPRHVSHFFRGPDAATDEDMLQLLDPFRPHRFYVLLLILKGTPPPPRRAPRGRLLRDRLRPPRDV